jgi:hypothetical protein
MNAQKQYLQSMEKGDMLRSKETNGQLEPSPVETSSKKLKGAIAGLSALHAKIHTDMPFAKREITLGYLDAKDFGKVFSGLRGVYLPMLGLASVVDIFERIVDKRDWKPSSPGGSVAEAKQAEIAEWNEIMQTLHEPFDMVSQAISEGLQHVSYMLKIVDKPKEKKKATDNDVEAKGDVVKPGDANFSEHLAVIDKRFWERRSEVLKLWCIQKGVSFPEDQTGEPLEKVYSKTIERVTSRDGARQQLYLILYVGFLL